MEKQSIALIHSRTFWAAALGLAAIVARAFNWSAVVEFAANPHSVDMALSGVAAAGSIGAIIFRTKAKSVVTGVISAKN